MKQNKLPISKLKLPIIVAGLSGAVIKTINAVTNFKIQDIRIIAYIMAEICSDLPPVKHDLNTVLNGDYNLSQCYPHKTLKISLLIGVDMFHKVLIEERIIIDKSGLVLLPTIFGKCILSNKINKHLDIIPNYCMAYEPTQVSLLSNKYLDTLKKIILNRKKSSF